MKIHRRRLLQFGLGLGLGIPALPCPAKSGPEAPANRPGAGFELEDLSLGDLRRGLAEGRWDSRELTRRYLERIEALDRHGPALRSVIEVNPDAPAIARALDRERRERGPRGPLHGIPVLVKDNLDTADRQATSAGSLALAEHRAAQDAFVVARLRAAGAVLLGKTNLSEWANFRSRRSTSGWSARGGQTRNPHALDRNPSGSSSGSAAAVAASLAGAALGTETDGSILSPASFCGIVGLKPTVGLLSRSGIIPISASQDTAGPMTRTVADAALLLGILAGPDPRDPATAAAGGRGAADYTVFLDPRGLRGARLGVIRPDGFPSGVQAQFATLLEAMRAEGADLVEPVELPGARELGAAEMTVLQYEFKDGLNAYLAGLGTEMPVRSLAALIGFNERNRDRELPWFGQELLVESEARGPLTDAAYRQARATCLRLARTEGLDAALDGHRLDALVAVTAGPAHATDLLHGDREVGWSHLPAAVAGYPSLTVPGGHVRGLPFGITFAGRAWSEPKLIRLAHAFEQATRQRRRPSFAPTVRPGAA